ncbi:hypothetical protein E0Z06_02415 [Rheinheimera sp. D18]|uniref:hypothetical protein n=1 Tax=Rheinheimera sp. D18 TaxID=2545632 RepID=UPI001046611E|nr:hypothetical protein [Rheinheimera sp. D18]QBL08446.1 hypothetical protein E0Z06_02415 [Rheinheimera sp. D18]
MLRWLSSFALLLYLSLLCTPQAFAVHDARLSPLADTQFHALTAQTQQCFVECDVNNTDDPQPALPEPTELTLASVQYFIIETLTASNANAYLTTPQARAPPGLSSTAV